MVLEENMRAIGLETGWKVRDSRGTQLNDARKSNAREHLFRSVPFFFFFFFFFQ